MHDPPRAVILGSSELEHLWPTLIGHWLRGQFRTIEGRFFNSCSQSFPFSSSYTTFVVPSSSSRFVVWLSLPSSHTLSPHFFYTFVQRNSCFGKQHPVSRSTTSHRPSLHGSRQRLHSSRRSLLFTVAVFVSSLPHRVPPVVTNSR